MTEASAPAKTTSRKRSKPQVARGIVHVHATFNNTIVTITDEQGNPISGSSAGACGTKGSRKGTPHAAGLAARQAATKAKERGLATVEIHLKGPGAGRDSVIRTIKEMGITITYLVEVTPIPHNGCRPRKRRRA